MDRTGFTEVKSSSSILASSSKTFLFRLPKDIDIHVLDGLQIDFSKENKDVKFHQDSESEYFYSIENVDTNHNIRPIISNSKSEEMSTSIGSNFTGIITVYKRYIIKPSQKVHVCFFTFTLFM